MLEVLLAYHLVTMEKIPTTRARKVCVQDVTVTYTRKQTRDGDVHVTVQDTKGRKLVLEIIPELPMETPAKGATIRACGILGYDKYHGWYELHPLVHWNTRR